MSDDSHEKEHRLFNQLMMADATQDEVEELYNDLKFMFDNPFDPFIQEAMVQRECTYVEMNSQRLN